MSYHPATELLILAHHCFTFTCHMEGIIRVLQAARMLTDNHLAPNEEYGLVVSSPLEPTIVLRQL